MSQPPLNGFGIKQIPVVSGFDTDAVAGIDQIYFEVEYDKIAGNGFNDRPQIG
jgi:hypothetical protein